MYSPGVVPQYRITLPVPVVLSGMLVARRHHRLLVELPGLFLVLLILCLVKLLKHLWHRHPTVTDPQISLYKEEDGIAPEQDEEP